MSKSFLELREAALKEAAKPADNQVEMEEGASGYKPGWMLKADPKLKAKVDANKAKNKEFKKLVGTKVDREPKGEYDRKVDSYLKKKYNKESVNEVTDAQLNKTLAMTKNMQQGIDALKKKHGMSDAAAKAAITRLMGKNEAWETDKGIEQKRKVAHDDTSESTAAYAKSEKERQEREARARLTKNDRVKLDKIRAMLAKEKK